jgi:hypothetical protein
MGRSGSFAARSWWKDEDEPAGAVEIGLFTARAAAEFRAEGERALEWLLSDDRRMTATGWAGGRTRRWRRASVG